jgi:hypothetical protein
MGRFDRLPGIDEENTTRRNVLAGVGYGFGGLIALGAVAGDSDDSDGDGGDGGGGGSDPTTAEPAATTAEPEAEPEPEPEPTTEPPTVEEPDPIHFEGSGDSVTDTFPVQGGFTVFELTHSGSRNFQVELLESGDMVELLANVIGDWDARNAHGVAGGDYRLDVSADGDWTITVRQPRPTDADVTPAAGETLTGDATDYFGPFSFNGDLLVSAAHSGERNFIVWVLQANGAEFELLFNEIGQYEGQTVFGSEGVGWIRVEAQGPYEITLE